MIFTYFVVSILLIIKALETFTVLLIIIFIAPRSFNAIVRVLEFSIASHYYTLISALVVSHLLFIIFILVLFLFVSIIFLIHFASHVLFIIAMFGLKIFVEYHFNITISALEVSLALHNIYTSFNLSNNLPQFVLSLFLITSDLWLFIVSHFNIIKGALLKAVKLDRVLIWGLSFLFKSFKLSA